MHLSTNTISMGVSTTSAILSATHDCFTLLEEGKEISAVFFDLTKAFDSVPHRQLIAKLEALIGLNAYIIRASLSEPHTSEANGGIFSSHNSMRLRHKTSCGSSPCPANNRDNPLST